MGGMMAKKVTLNATTGDLEEVEMVGDELASYEAQRGPLPELPVSIPERVALVLVGAPELSQATRDALLAALRGED